ncbi:nucleoside diphosphate kinase 6 isoform X2 [Onychomys torridus]|uniref:nucleoside diphosphate kinase 6 isoform X2 n=1 Tax=Onychomys torridus TaxID=38674 RepID=UPI00167F5A00|nr:nucleoside diphosphate kinase 6 isoform X2 [Onychomys torridus]
MTAFSRKTVADSPNQRAFVEEPHTPFYRSPVLPRRPLNSLALGWLDQVHALIPPAKYCGKPGPYWGPCIGTKAVHQQILSNKFLIVRMRELQWRREDCRRFYREHEGRFFYQRLVEFMASGPIRAYILAHKDAIQLWRTLMGPTRVFRARHMAPDSIRGSLGLTDTRNTTHGSERLQRSFLTSVNSAGMKRRNRSCAVVLCATVQRRASTVQLTHEAPNQPHKAYQSLRGNHGLKALSLLDPITCPKT